MARVVEADETYFRENSRGSRGADRGRDSDLRSVSVLCTGDWFEFVRVARDAIARHFVSPSRSANKRKKEIPKALGEAVVGALSLARVNVLHVHL